MRAKAEAEKKNKPCGPNLLHMIVEININISFKVGVTLHISTLMLYLPSVGAR
jgi:hypothetical protein